MKNGKIVPNGVILEKHEYKTILLFTEMGIDVELIPKSERKGIHAPDVIAGVRKRVRPFKKFAKIEDNYQIL